MEHDKGGRDEAEGEDDADGVGQTDPNLPAVTRLAIIFILLKNFMKILTSTPCRVVALYNSSGG